MRRLTVLGFLAWVFACSETPPPPTAGTAAAPYLTEIGIAPGESRVWPDGPGPEPEIMGPGGELTDRAAGRFERGQGEPL